MHVGVPAEVTHAAVVVLDGTNIVSSTPLQPWRDGLPIVVPADREAHVAAFDLSSLSGLDGEPLIAAGRCDSPMPEPLWFAAYRTTGGVDVLDPSAAPAFGVGSLARPCPACGQVDLETVILPGTRDRGRLSLGARLSDGRFVVALAGGELFAIEGGLAVPIPVSTSTPHLFSFTRRGETYFVGNDGAIARGTSLDALAPVSPPGIDAPEARSWAWIDVAPESEELDLFAVTNDDRFLAYDGAWRTLAVRRPGEEPGKDRGGVARVTATEAFAIGVRGTAVLHHHDGVIDEEVVEGTSVTPTALAAIRGRVLLGTDSGQVFAREDGLWRQIEGSPIAGPMRTFVPLDDGFLAGGTGGVFAEHHEATGFCPPLAYAPHTVWRVVQDGPDLVFLASGFGYDSEVTFARRR
jgi:hypothetical protein